VASGRSTWEQSPTCINVEASRRSRRQGGGRVDSTRTRGAGGCDSTRWFGREKGFAVPSQHILVLEPDLNVRGWILHKILQLQGKRRVTSAANRRWLAGRQGQRAAQCLCSEVVFVVRSASLFSRAMAAFWEDMALTAGSPEGLMVGSGECTQAARAAPALFFARRPFHDGRCDESDARCHALPPPRRRHSGLRFFPTAAAVSRCPSSRLTPTFPADGSSKGCPASPVLSSVGARSADGPGLLDAAVVQARSSV
jgi:hypothetical protein